MKTVAQVWAAWMRSGLVKRVAELARSEWHRRFPDVPIKDDVVRVKHDRTGGGDFLRALIHGEDDRSALRLTFYPHVKPPNKNAYWDETRP